MDALILSSGTGGGHNGAAHALWEELNRRGHQAVVLDPYTLVSDSLARTIGDMYINLVRKAPPVFSALYYMGEAYRRLPLHSPVYAANRGMIRAMTDYLGKNHYDALLLTHFFPGEILTAVKRKGEKLPPVFYVATDYTCIPFTEEVDFDYCIIPDSTLKEEFAARGIAQEKILPFGIPVREEFCRSARREELLNDLNLQAGKRYILLTGGSIGAGKLSHVVARLQPYLRAHPDHVLIVVCGSNQPLYEKLCARYAGCDQILLLQVTKHLGDYMKVSDVLITKPGGLTSTEAAACGIPMIHVCPIAGCETKNLKFFSSHGLSVNLAHHLNQIGSVLENLSIPDNAKQMIRQQKTLIPSNAAAEICAFIEAHVSGQNVSA